MINDPSLGQEVHELLAKAELEGPFTYNPGRANALYDAFTTMLYSLGGDLENSSIAGTADRLLRMYLEEICSGLNYANFPRVHLQPSGGLDEIVLERNIKVHSLCEHHFVPIIGVAYVAYIPKNHIIGLSKLNRIVDF